MTIHEEIPADNSAILKEPAPKSKAFQPDRADECLAYVAFLLGFLFIRWVFFSWQGWGVSLYTALFITVVLFYLRQKKKRMTGESWFWFTILLLTALSFSLWPGQSVFGLRALLLLGVAIYWVWTTADATLYGKTSDWLPHDLLSSIIYTPFENFFAQYRSLAAARKRQIRVASEHWPIVFGVLLAAAVISIVGPLLIQADAGGFAALLRNLQPHLDRLGKVDPVLLVQILFSIPTAAYIFGLLAGSIHGRRVELKSAENSVNALHKLPYATVFTLLLLLNGLYIAFIASQLPYLFSAFSGTVPPGWESYAEFARRGFFELCVIAVINLLVLTGTHLGIEITKRQSAATRVLNSLLAALTLVLIATAFSKLALYISIFGLTVQRLLPGVLLIFLAIVFGGVIARQSLRFSIMRLAAFTGTTLLCLLFVINTDALVVNYNANRYLSGTLTEFDTIVLYRSGTAGLGAALLLYEQSDDQQLRAELDEYFDFIYWKSKADANTLRDTLQAALARRQLEEHQRIFPSSSSQVPIENTYDMQN
ncbi:MAG: DUF4173 domain-containing protein [Dethiobacter sp.]|jgi:hypothetical protein|nr:DUF4173 domain-containing protein [Dethiobacter sp.]MBS3899746.1 DUF4173 domain-containing protein [Dethiobacter sp.]MBS3983537.1 DUF4173 domain-containing protein [Dethiobacter sp.]MCL4463636.1 DUF4173 domain-containing protein [Bacillota bacterium]MCL5993914.1 DUF4173 domain-containing protein [Bacillota bacterium]